MNRPHRPRSGTAALCLTLTIFGGVAGCAGQNGGSATSAETSATPTSSIASPTTTSSQPACRDVIAKGNALVSVATQFANGQATGAQVTTAAAELKTALVTAKVSASSQLRPYLDAAQTAADQLGHTLQAQPVVVADVRAAARSTLTSLQALPSVCA